MSYNATNYMIQFTMVKSGTGASQVVSEMNNLQLTFDQAGAKVEQFGNKSLRSLQGLIFGLQMSTFYASMFATGLMRDDTALISLEMAQDRYNKALREHGRGSEEATQASRQLEIATINLNRAQMMNSIMTVSIGLQMVGLAASIWQALPSIGQMISKLRELAVVQTVVNALTGVGGWAKLAVGAAIGAAAVGGTIALMNSGQSSSSKVNVSVSQDSDIINQYLQRTGGTNVKTLGAT